MTLRPLIAALVLALGCCLGCGESPRGIMVRPAGEAKLIGSSACDVWDATFDIDVTGKRLQVGAGESKQVRVWRNCDNGRTDCTLKLTVEEAGELIKDLETAIRRAEYGHELEGVEI